MKIKLFGTTYTFVSREGDRLTIEREDAFVNLPAVTARIVSSEGSYHLVFTSPEDLAPTSAEQNVLTAMLSSAYTRARAREINPERITRAAEDRIRDSELMHVYIQHDVPPIQETNPDKQGFPCWYVTAHIQVNECACDSYGEFSLSDGDQIPTCLVCGGIELLRAESE